MKPLDALTSELLGGQYSATVDWGRARMFLGNAVGLEREEIASWARLRRKPLSAADLLVYLDERAEEQKR